MNIYDKIKNPLDDDKTIKALLKIYAKHGRISYNDIVTYGENENVDKVKQTDEFNDNILINCIQHEIDSLKQSKADTKKDKLLDYTNRRNKKLKEIDKKINDVQKENENYKEGYERCKTVFDKLNKIPLIPAKALDQNTKLAEDLRNNNITQKDLEDYEKCNSLILKEIQATQEKEEYIQKHPDFKNFYAIIEKYTAEDFMSILNNEKTASKKDEKTVNEFLDFVNDKHSFFYDHIMGYHIYKKHFEKVDRSKPMNEAKLYINADYSQLYKIANLFWKKAEDRDIDYNFKVNNPNIDSENRSDKLVIFSTLDNLNTYVEILDEIKQEHPEFKFKNPGLLVGKLDNNIGIGMDPEKSSYNVTRADFLDDVLTKYFKGLGKSEVNKTLKSDKEIIHKVKAKIKKRLLKSDISEKFYLDKNKEEEFKKATSDKSTERKSNEPKSLEGKKDKSSEEKDKKKNKPSENGDKKQDITSKNSDQNQDKPDENSNKKKDKQDKKGKEKQDKTKESEKSMNENLEDLKNVIKSMSLDYEQGGKEYLANEEKLKNLMSTLYEQKAKKLNIKESLLEKRMNERRLDAIVSNVVKTAQKLKQQEKYSSGVAKKDLKEFEFSMNELNKYFSDNEDIEKNDKETISNDSKER